MLSHVLTPDSICYRAAADSRYHDSERNHMVVTVIASRTLNRTPLLDNSFAFLSAHGQWADRGLTGCDVVVHIDDQPAAFEKISEAFAMMLGCKFVFSGALESSSAADGDVDTVSEAQIRGHKGLYVTIAHAATTCANNCEFSFLLDGYNSADIRSLMAGRAIASILVVEASYHSCRPGLPAHPFGFYPHSITQYNRFNADPVVFLPLAPPLLMPSLVRSAGFALAHRTARAPSEAIVEDMLLDRVDSEADMGPAEYRRQRASPTPAEAGVESMLLEGLDDDMDMENGSSTTSTLPVSGASTAAGDAHDGMELEEGSGSPATGISIGAAPTGLRRQYAMIWDLPRSRSPAPTGPMDAEEPVMAGSMHVEVEGAPIALGKRAREADADEADRDQDGVLPAKRQRME